MEAGNAGGEAAPRHPRTIVVLAGGDAVDPALAHLLPVGAFVIAADSGLAQAPRLGLRVDLAVGDFDSVHPDALAAAERTGCRIERHPATKEHTYLELALLAARARGADRVTVVGGHGGRLDHLLGNALVLAGTSTDGMEVDALMGAARVHVVRPGATVDMNGYRGELVSLLAVGGPATGVRTSGLRYPLSDQVLYPGSTRGVSNEMDLLHTSVSLSGGTLLVVRPGHRDGEPDRPPSSSTSARS